MPALLLLDTCGTTNYVALLHTDTASIQATQTLPARETQERLLPAIAALLAASTEPLAAIAVVTGPGSFTGVRIGLAAVKGLAEARTLPLLALSRLAILAQTAPPDTPVTAWIDAGRTDLYTRSATTETMLPREAAITAAANTTLVLEDPTLAPPYHPHLVPTPEALQQAAATLALHLFHAKTFADTALLDANYLRVPDAETALRARQTAAANPDTATA